MGLNKAVMASVKKVFRGSNGNAVPVPTYASDASNGNFPFRSEYEGWNFRIHGANGGTILEVWYSGDSSIKNYKSTYPSAAPNFQNGDHKLFVFADVHELLSEMPSIFTQLSLESP